MNVTTSDGANLYFRQVTTVTTVIALVVLLGGLISNIVLLGLVLKKLASGKRNDMLFLVNIIAANIFAYLEVYLDRFWEEGKLFHPLKSMIFSITRSALFRFSTTSPQWQPYVLLYTKISSNFQKIVCLIFHSH